MKLIPLTRGLFAQVDDEDFEYLNQWKWNARKGVGTYYAARGDWNGGNNNTITMHRFILNAKKAQLVDHKDRNGLNNQKNNIRICTSSQNRANSIASGKSKYKGVHFSNGGKFICAQIQKGRIKRHLGTFKTEEDAARAYDNAAIELHGIFANLNFKL